MLGGGGHLRVRGGGQPYISEEEVFIVFPNARNVFGKPLASNLDTWCKNTTKSDRMNWLLNPR